MTKATSEKIEVGIVRESTLIQPELKFEQKNTGHSSVPMPEQASRLSDQSDIVLKSVRERTRVTF